MAKLYYYEVAGKPQFPLDMLRYDNCHPVDGGSVDGLTASGDDVIVVRLGSPKKPTPGRWKSFGWIPGKVEHR